MLKRLYAEKKKAVKVMMPPSLIQQVQTESCKKGVSMNEFIRLGVIEHIQKEKQG